MVVLPGAVANAALDLQLQQWSGRTCRGIKQVRLGSPPKPRSIEVG